jgi:hypothetical protein
MKRIHQLNKTRILQNTVKRSMLLLTAAVMLLLISRQEALAQGHNQEVTIVAPYQPTISDAAKMTLTPQVEDTVVNVPPMHYAIHSEPIYSPFEVKPLKPAFVEINPGETYRRNYLKAGFGNYTTPYVEFFSNSLRSDKFSLGLHLRHLSSQGGIKDYANSSYSQNLGELYGKRYFKNSVLSAEVDYHRNVVHYYGFKPSDYAGINITDDQLKQRFSTVSAAIGYKSNYKRDGKPNYDTKVDFYNLTDLYETGETMVAFDGNLNTRNEFLNFVKKQELGIDLNADYYHNSDSLQSQGTAIVSLRPYLNIDFDYLSMYLGVEGTFAGDSTSKFYVYPEVRISYQVIPDHLRFYISATGGLTRNSFKSVSDINPWVNSVFPLGNTSTQYDIAGGLTGNVKEVVDYNFKVSYAHVQNMLFYVNDFFDDFSPEMPYNLANKFTGIYDDVNLTSAGLEVTYHQSEQLDVLFTANYYHYDMKTQEKPWHKPAFDAVATGRYKLNKKVNLSAELFFQSKIYAPTWEKVWGGYEMGIQQRSCYADINLGGEYRFTDRIAVFLQLNNVAAIQYYRWYNYPTQRFNLLGGLTFSF